MSFNTISASIKAAISAVLQTHNFSLLVSAMREMSSSTHGTQHELPAAAPHIASSDVPAHTWTTMQPDNAQYPANDGAIMVVGVHDTTTYAAGQGNYPGGD